MGIRDLKLTEMVPITARWLGEQREVFSSIPEISPLIPVVEAAHVPAARSLELAVTETQIAHITDALLEVDNRHDDLVRVAHDALEVAIRWARRRTPPDFAAALRYESALSVLLPDGLSLVKASYALEAGRAAQLHAVLDPSLEATLKEVPLQEGTVLDAVLAWREVGKQLGELEAKRSVLAGGSGDLPKLNEVRLAWLRAVTLVQRMLAVSSAPSDKIDQILQPLLAAGAAAGRRQAARA